MKFTIITLGSIDSTNNEAIRQARMGAPEGLCIVAHEQTAGRGRQGRSWLSPKNAGLYISVVVRPKLQQEKLTLVTLAMGIAVYDSLAGIALSPDIKWVNDLLIGDKKISGILSEAVETPIGTAVVVGIGVNLLSSVVVDDGRNTATSIENETSRIISPDEMSAMLLPCIDRTYSLLISDPDRIIQEWQNRSSWYSGKPVRVSWASEHIEGITDGLEPNGSLRVKGPDGAVKIVNSGEVEALRSKTSY